MNHSNGRVITLDYKAKVYAGQLQNLLASGQASQMTETIRQYLDDHGLDADAAKRFQLGVVEMPAPDDAKFAGCLVIPYLTRSGVKSIKYRCVADHDHHALKHGKYGQHAGQPPRLYNPAAFFEADGTIGICEGEVDAAVATVSVGVPSLGVPGVDNWDANSSVWKRTLDDYDRVVIFADGDKAGIGMARTIAEDLGKKALIIRCEDGQDVSSTVAAGNAQELRDRVDL